MSVVLEGRCQVRADIVAIHRTHKLADAEVAGVQTLQS